VLGCLVLSDHLLVHPFRCGHVVVISTQRDFGRLAGSSNNLLRLNCLARIEGLYFGNIRVLKFDALSWRGLSLKHPLLPRPSVGLVTELAGRLV